MSGFFSKNVRELGSQVPDFLHVCKNEDDLKNEDKLKNEDNHKKRRPQKWR